MPTSMAVTALFMGLVGGPHCVAMCGAACAGIGRAAGDRGIRALLVFQLSRLLGYSLLGAVAAGSVQTLGWLGTQTSVVRPAWTLFHGAAILLGTTLVWQARQPAWLEAVGRKVWQKVRPALAPLGPGAPMVLGMAWALMPCGLLYSALLVASLSAAWWEGAVTMALFAVGTSVSLFIGPSLMLRLGQVRSGEWAIRLAGVALAITSGWALWKGLTQPTGLWCS